MLAVSPLAVRQTALIFRKAKWPPFNGELNKRNKPGLGLKPACDTWHGQCRLGHRGRPFASDTSYRGGLDATDRSGHGLQGRRLQALK